MSGFTDCAPAPNGSENRRICGVSSATTAPTCPDVLSRPASTPAR